MTKIKLLSSFLFIFISVAISQVNLTIDDISVNAGETFTLDISMENPNDVIGGFQFVLNDFPNQLDLVDVTATDRTEHMLINFEETLINVFID